MKKMFTERFDMNDLGEARVCLELQITRNRKEKKLRLSQQGYIEKIVQSFGMSESKPLATPMGETNARDERLELVLDKEKLAAGAPYREKIGSLMPASVNTRNGNIAMMLNELFAA